MVAQRAAQEERYAAPPHQPQTPVEATSNNKTASAEAVDTEQGEPRGPRGESLELSEAAFPTLTLWQRIKRWFGK